MSSGMQDASWTARLSNQPNPAYSPPLKVQDLNL